MELRWCKGQCVFIFGCPPGRVYFKDQIIVIDLFYKSWVGCVTAIVNTGDVVRAVNFKVNLRRKKTVWTLCIIYLDVQYQTVQSKCPVSGFNGI